MSELLAGSAILARAVAGHAMARPFPPASQGLYVEVDELAADRSLQPAASEASATDQP